MRKASLSLSVNAIVILILAIVMLGLGITFIKNMFGKVSNQIDQMVSKEPDPPSPFSSEPITLSRENLITRPGQTEVIKVGVYNAWGGSSSVASANCQLLQSGNDNIADFNDCVASTTTMNSNMYYQSCGTLMALGCTRSNVVPLLGIPQGQCVGGDASHDTWFTCSNPATPISCTSISQATHLTGGVVCAKIGCGPADAVGQCTGGGSAGSSTKININCPNAALNTSINANLQSTSKLIPAGELANLNIVFGVGNQPAGTYLCSIWIEQGYSKDFVIDIRK